MLKKAGILIKGLWYFVWGNVFALMYYDRKYLQGRYFRGRFKGLLAPGWKWAACDGASRLFLRANQGVPWPVSYKVVVPHPKRIVFDPDDLHIFHINGTYFQGIGANTIIGKGTWIASNVGLITSNHNIDNPELHVEAKEIIIGKKCWIGMNSIILPGVILGDYTTVGAGSVVTKSFSMGYCVIAGNPAKIIKNLDKSGQENITNSWIQ